MHALDSIVSIPTIPGRRETVVPMSSVHKARTIEPLPAPLQDRQDQVEILPGRPGAHTQPARVQQQAPSVQRRRIQGWGSQWRRATPAPSSSLFLIDAQLVHGTAQAAVCRDSMKPLGELVRGVEIRPSAMPPGERKPPVQLVSTPALRQMPRHMMHQIPCLVLATRHYNIGGVSIPFVNLEMRSIRKSDLRIERVMNIAENSPLNNSTLTLCNSFHSSETAAADADCAKYYNLRLHATLPNWRFRKGLLIHQK